MGSSREWRPGDLDTSQPGVRQIQAWIREQLPLSVQLLNGSSVTGRPLWVDACFLALESEPGTHSLLINRDAIAMLRPLA
ncbi:hypothetical protein [Synechococcus sp. NB0720_010]|uniref:Hfq-related RNA-binding protein n=1 Tax=Synechococcus sp. NB0720_010 TaxID=2907159 RepID=UPI001FF8776D|nr:hypothetical protein [Synechococcus sp. NB0720_010]UPH90476.1 hypothetical protein LY254_01835 [Synechococcus sp. NB0720_010]